jgi:hypothetical protein
VADYGFQGELFDSLLNEDLIEVMRGASQGRVTWQTLQGETDTLQGEQGVPGADGADSFVPGPQGTPGVDGDDSTVAGPQGEPGVNGADSVVPGPQGDPGTDGNDGAPGVDAMDENTYLVMLLNRNARFTQTQNVIALMAS